MQISKKIIASAVISEIQSSDKHLTIRGKLCDTKTNLNGVRVTEAFIDEIVANADEYYGTPLCADVRGLLNNRKIGHMYNQATGEFMSSIIGSMQSFERSDSDDGTVSLIFTARVMKRYTKICNALATLFSEGKLKFSFEVCCGAYTTDEDGTFIVDADPSNYLEGAAVVTLPACEEAVALELVAECLGEGGEENMAKKKVNTEQVDEQMTEPVTVNAEEEVKDQTSEPAEVHAEAAPDVPAEEVQAEAADTETEQQPEVQTAETETAEMYVTLRHREEDSVSTYDTDTGVSTYESVEHTIHVDGPEGSLTTTNVEAESTAESSVTSEEQASLPAVETQTAEEQPAEDDNGSNTESTQTAEHVQDNVSMIAQILEKLEMLSSRIGKIEALAESISQHEEPAEENTALLTAEESEAEQDNSDNEEQIQVNAERTWSLVNPFTSEMSVPKKKYSLLEDKPERKSYTLL